MKESQYYLSCLVAGMLVVLASSTSAYSQQIRLQPYVGINTVLMADRVFDRLEETYDWTGSLETQTFLFSYDHSAKLTYLYGLKVEYETERRIGYQVQLGLLPLAYSLNYFHRYTYLNEGEGRSQSFEYWKTSERNQVFFLMQSFMATTRVGNRWRLAAGPYAGVYLKSFEDNPIYARHYEINESNQREGHGYKKAQLGLSGEVTYQIKNLVFSAQFQQSMTRLIRREVDANAANYPFIACLTTGYTFRL